MHIHFLPSFLVVVILLQLNQGRGSLASTELSLSFECTIKCWHRIFWLKWTDLHAVFFHMASTEAGLTRYSSFAHFLSNLGGHCCLMRLGEHPPCLYLMSRQTIGNRVSCAKMVDRVRFVQWPFQVFHTPRFSARVREHLFNAAVEIGISNNGTLSWN